jgi:hypothetical protein
MVRMQPQTPRDGVTVNRARALFFWLLAVGTTIVLYWACLRYLQPGYFSPESVYHIDFYDYAGMRMKSALGLLFNYPRPVAFLAMKLLGYGGLYGTMIGSAALALVNLLLTVLYVRRRFALDSPWMAVTLVLYLLLNIAHPQFYVEHRHDQPAQVSYFFLMVTLLAWTAWLDLRETPKRRFIANTLILLVAFLSAIAFAFSKETYFVSALCLVAALALSDPLRRSRHLWFLGFLLVIEVASLLWTRHVNSPFVNPNAAVESTYRISIAPLSVARTFLFYAYHLVNPAMVLAVLASLYFAVRNRLSIIQACAFPVAAFAAIAPHAILPNHKFPEYAWSGAPLLLVPILLVAARSADRLSVRAQLLTVAVLSALAVFGPAGYVSRYGSEDLAYVKQEEKLNAAIIRSFDKFHGLPASSRVLVTGLDDPVVPWQIADFIRSEFGDNVYWTVVFPPKVQFRRSSRVTAFIDPAGVQLTDFDYIATYHPTGELADFRSLDKASVPKRLPAAYIPALATSIGRAQARPADSAPSLDVAAALLDWGFHTEAVEFLDRAQNLGADPHGRYRDLMARARELSAAHQAARAISVQLTAQPPVIRSDGSGLGVTELVWQVPDGLAVELHVDSPDGPMFAAATASGRAKTEKWVKDGTEFFLQNVTGGKPLTRDNTLATVKVKVLQ